MSNRVANLIYASLLSLVSPVLAAAELSDSEVLNQLYSRGAQIVRYGEKAKGKIRDMQLREYNERMLQDHRIALKTISDLKETLDLDLNTVSFELASPKAKESFGKTYVRETKKLHADMLELIDAKLIPETTSAQVEAILVNYEARVRALLRNARHLNELL